MEKRIKALGEGKGTADGLLATISKAVNPTDEAKQKKLKDIGGALTGLGKDVGKEDSDIKSARAAIQKLEQRIKEKPLTSITVEEIQGFDKEAKGIFSNVDGLKTEVSKSEDDLKRILAELNALACKLNEDRRNEAEKAY